MAGLPARVLEFLEKPNVAVLATVGRSGRPQVTPVWFMMEDGRILINTSRGRVKLRNIEADPRVTLTIVDRENLYSYVQIQGRVVRIDPARGAQDIDRLSLRYRGKAYAYPPTDRPENRINILIEPQRVGDHVR